jgi:gamma-glutamyl:cysteine ligase YbdK (ATP-grasp superfamily)
VVPEPAATRAQYESEILRPIYDDLAALDPEGILRYEWVNARGCIARFDRSAIEIRVLDLQETPRADVAIAALVSESVRRLCEGHGATRAQQDAFETDRLAAIFRATLVDAERTRIDDLDYLRTLGIETSTPLEAGEVWQQLLSAGALAAKEPVLAATLEFVLERGSLARRILRATGPDPSRARIVDVYRHLADGLLADRRFDERELGRA